MRNMFNLSTFSPLILLDREGTERCFSFHECRLHRLCTSCCECTDPFERRRRVRDVVGELDGEFVRKEKGESENGRGINLGKSIYHPRKSFPSSLSLFPSLPFRHLGHSNNPLLLPQLALPSLLFHLPIQPCFLQALLSLHSLPILFLIEQTQS